MRLPEHSTCASCVSRMAAVQQMPRSRSLPGLMALGTSSLSDKGHHRKGTLGYHLDAPVDRQSPSPATDHVKSLAMSLSKPSWRLAATEPRPAEQPNNISKNMRHPRVAPAWLKHDKQVLRFYGFFQESVAERMDENCRYRNVVLMYCLEDGTVRISEPKVENSGIPQGEYLRRHHVPKPDGSGNLGPTDFRIGEELEIYGRVYHITGCDRFTRWFFEENGLELPEDETVPKDMWHKSYTFSKLLRRAAFRTRGALLRRSI